MNAHNASFYVLKNESKSEWKVLIEYEDGEKFVSDMTFPDEESATEYAYKTILELSTDETAVQ